MKHSVLTTSIGLFFAAACGGRVGSDARPAPPSDAPTATAAPSYNAEQMAEAGARCAAPHGDAEPYATVDALVALLAANWLYCGTGAKPTPLPYSRGGTSWIGAEVTADGHFYWLASDARAGVVRGTGIAGAASYEIIPPYDAEYNNVSLQINVWYADKSVMPTRATFEKAPRRLELEGIDGYFVALDG